MEAQYGKVWEQCHFSQLKRIKHLGDVKDYNSKFQVFFTTVDNISDQNLLEDYMVILKEYIKMNFA